MFTETINGINLTFETNSTVFSPTCVDKGTLAMLAEVTLSPGDKLLDLGCGYGPVGIYAAKVIGVENIYMTDSNKNAITLATKNAAKNATPGITITQSDGFKNIQEKDFTLILSNPPYHADFSVPKHFIEKGFNRLALGGKMYMVTKRKDWYKNKLTAIFGGVRITEADGYYIFCAEKRSAKYANK
ncbi:MAG: methyltransferase [Defluviitaleaceae bacterium]|nr:methyltransferase [Defluviitaleaceae bacterium]